MGRNKFINSDEINNNSNNNNNNEPHSDYSDHIYVEQGKGTEDLYDRNNPLVKLILFIVGGIALVGTIYYVITAVLTMK